MTFQRDIAISEMATTKAAKVLQKNDIKLKIVNEKGHDILTDDGKKIEVKFDTWIVQRKTGNLSAEWWSNEDKKTPGWAQYSDADILIYMYSFDEAYVLDMKKLQKFVIDNFEKLEKKYYDKKKGKAWNILVPIKIVEHLRLKKFEEMFTKIV